ncbi:uncharacterized protein Bfra_003586 [Botrytis fragariae]|uniref:DUF7587 domain-containing protein n=1 Tax=Botrytis fragariae TaxID=1964551 RepID=A0A8H6EK19_9HELO|nr:uncharacterized protein Bfra_003586 [Botrytis fragariae]KAF5875133.1 hypothetical protein Bfra_003586 [Botrytis fragariae]
MALSVDAVASLVKELNIADKTSEVDSQVPGHSSSTLQDSIQSLDQSVKVISSQAQQAHSLAGSIPYPSSLDITQINLLCRLANEVTEAVRILDDTANTLKNAREVSIVASLTSLGGQGGAKFRDGSLLQRMLTHFDEQIRSIVRGVLDNSSDVILWKIAEECYNQASSYSGSLHTDNYFVPHDEALLERPYDPDYQAEGYYEHEDRLLIDQNYAKSIEEQTQHRREEREREEELWVDFWVFVLGRCPNGPTLFHPPANHEIELHMLGTADIPHYLFRTFDTMSSGKNDNSVVASLASVHKPPYDSRIDLLSLSAHEATHMMHTHLAKHTCGGEYSDNLVSWTSSLLFAIQYAIWRRRRFRCSAANIQICAVDTRRFPHGQFAPDMWLLQAYHNTAAKLGGDTKRFFHFRLGDERYQNGEFLSQGSVHHAGRSCVVSLEKLQESELYNLYPELAEEEGMNRWSNRVLELRRRWSEERLTSAQELDFAEMVARRCFHAFEAADMMLILLTFKARKMKEYPKDDNKNCPKWARKPDEVRRYVSAAGLLKSRKQTMNGRGGASLRISNGVSGIQIVKEMFDYI